ncbi:MAG: HAMP domain-containing histidine kinase [Deltaproteobacteria bacterium]|nr:HAMP domain-containing histidine kinase [Deltaproteobacteria bacterium]
MKSFQSRTLSLGLAICGIAAAAGLAIGVASIRQGRKALDRSIANERSLLAARAASALAARLEACRKELDAGGAGLRSSACASPLRWFAWRSGVESRSPGQYRQLRTALGDRASRCIEHGDGCVPLAFELAGLGAELDPLVAVHGVGLLREQALSDGNAQRSLIERLQQVLFHDAIRRHHTEIASLQAGRWLRIGRYCLTRPGAAGSLIGLDCRPGAAGLRSFLIRENVFDGDPYRFSLIPPDSPSPVEAPGVSHAFVHSLLGTLRVEDPLAADRLRAARAGSDQALVWMGLAALALFAGLGLIHRSLRMALANVRMRENFVASVSHEFRTPLGSLGLMIDTLRQGRVSDPDRRQAYLEQMGRETHRLSRLAENILALGRLQRRSAGEAQRWSPAALWARVQAQLLPEALGRISLVKTELDGLPAGRGDPDLVQIAWLNLVDNALKYSPEDRQVEVSIRRESDEILFRVDDRGAGIPRRDRAKIFEWFSRRADRAQRSGAPGSGLGLALVREVARIHGGRIELGNRPGGGARFELSMPIAGGQA